VDLNHQEGWAQRVKSTAAAAKACGAQESMEVDAAEVEQPQQELPRGDTYTYAEWDAWLELHPEDMPAASRSYKDAVMSGVDSRPSAPGPNRHRHGGGRQAQRTQTYNRSSPRNGTRGRSGGRR
jgi:hypothetical protein